MADRIWVGVDGSFSTTTNWNPNGFATADRFFFTDASQQDVTTDLANTGIDCSLFRSRKYTGQIGNSSADALDLGTITELRIEGGQDATHITSNGTISDTYISTGSGISSSGSLAGTLASLVIVSSQGGMDITTGSTITLLQMSRSPGFRLNVPAGCTFTEARVAAGQVECSSNCPAVKLMSGAYWIHDGSATIATELEMFGYGGSCICDYRSSGVLTRVSGWGPQALFDGRSNTNSGGTVTITDSRGHDGFRMLLRTGLDTFALTNSFEDFGAFTDFELGEGVGKG